MRGRARQIAGAHTRSERAGRRQLPPEPSLPEGWEDQDQLQTKMVTAEGPYANRRIWTRLFVTSACSHLTSVCIDSRSITPLESSVRGESGGGRGRGTSGGGGGRRSSLRGRDGGGCGRGSSRGGRQPLRGSRGLRDKSRGGDGRHGGGGSLDGGLSSGNRLLGGGSRRRLGLDGGSRSLRGLDGSRTLGGLDRSRSFGGLDRSGGLSLNGCLGQARELVYFRERASIVF